MSRILRIGPLLYAKVVKISPDEVNFVGIHLHCSFSPAVWYRMKWHSTHYFVKLLGLIDMTIEYCKDTITISYLKALESLLTNVLGMNMAKFNFSNLYPYFFLNISFLFYFSCQSDMKIFVSCNLLTKLFLQVQSNSFFLCSERR